MTCSNSTVTLVKQNGVWTGAIGADGQLCPFSGSGGGATVPNTGLDVAVNGNQLTVSVTDSSGTLSDTATLPSGTADTFVTYTYDATAQTLVLNPADGSAATTVNFKTIVQDCINAGTNVTLTPQADGSVTIDAAGGGGVDTNTTNASADLSVTGLDLTMTVTDSDGNPVTDTVTLPSGSLVPNAATGTAQLTLPNGDTKNDIVCGQQATVALAGANITVTGNDGSTQTFSPGSDNISVVNAINNGELTTTVTDGSGPIASTAISVSGTIVANTGANAGTATITQLNGQSKTDVTCGPQAVATNPTATSISVTGNDGNTATLTDTNTTNAMNTITIVNGALTSEIQDSDGGMVTSTAVNISGTITSNTGAQAGTATITQLNGDSKSDVVCGQQATFMVDGTTGEITGTGNDGSTFSVTPGPATDMVVSGISCDGDGMATVTITNGTPFTWDVVSCFSVTGTNDATVTGSGTTNDPWVVDVQTITNASVALSEGNPGELIVTVTDSAGTPIASPGFDICPLVIDCDLFGEATDTVANAAAWAQPANPGELNVIQDASGDLIGLTTNSGRYPLAASTGGTTFVDDGNGQGTITDPNNDTCAVSLAIPQDKDGAAFAKGATFNVLQPSDFTAAALVAATDQFMVQAADGSCKLVQPLVGGAEETIAGAAPAAQTPPATVAAAATDGTTVSYCHTTTYDDCVRTWTFANGVQIKFNETITNPCNNNGVFTTVPTAVTAKANLQIFDMDTGGGDIDLTPFAVAGVNDAVFRNIGTQNMTFNQTINGATIPVVAQGAVSIIRLCRDTASGSFELVNLS